MKMRVFMAGRLKYNCEEINPQCILHANSEIAPRPGWIRSAFFRLRFSGASPISSAFRNFRCLRPSFPQATFL
jgi:hypothetical protein